MYASLHNVFMLFTIWFLRFIHVDKYIFSSFVVTASCLCLTLLLKRRSVGPECALLFYNSKHICRAFSSLESLVLQVTLGIFLSVLWDLVQVSLHCETHTSSFNGFPLSIEHTVNAIIFLNLPLTYIQTPFSARDRLAAGMPGTPVHASRKKSICPPSIVTSCHLSYRIEGAFIPESQDSAQCSVPISAHS